jgi:cell wall-associated NlpC family hydrolase
VKAVFPVADIVENPEESERIGKGESQLLFGEPFAIENEEGSWFYGTSKIDGYKGYVRRDCLGEEKQQATHFVSGLSALVYPKADFKSRPHLNLSFLSRLTITNTDETDGFYWAEGAGWVPAMHVLPLEEMKNPVDILDTAMMFINSPYRYGGRLAWGIDCSALVQLALIRNGIPCPRDSHQQQDSPGQKIKPEEADKGDLIFFEGHAGIMTCKENVLNASCRTMGIRIEPLNKLVELYEAPVSVRRI